MISSQQLFVHLLPFLWSSFGAIRKEIHPKRKKKKGEGKAKEKILDNNRAYHDKEKTLLGKRGNIIKQVLGLQKNQMQNTSRIHDIPSLL